MKVLKKVFVYIMTMMLIMAMIVPAAAGDDAIPASDATYTITVQGTATGHTYEAYQIFSGKINDSGVLTDVNWGSGIDTSKEADLIAALQAWKPGMNITNAAGAAQALNNASSADGLKFASIVAKFLSGSMKTSTADGTKYTIGGLETGYYLIKDQDNSLDESRDESYTAFILSLSKNTTVNPKSGHPSIHKKVSESGVEGTYDEWVTQSIGSKVHFDIRGTLPGELHYYDKYYYAFHDTMSKGLTYDDGSVSVSRIDANGNTDVIDRECYTVSVSDATDENGAVIGTKLQVTFNCDGEKKGLLSATSTNSETGEKKLLILNRSDMIRLHYTATLNGNTQIGIANPDTNAVELEYSNNPHTEGTGLTHKVDVDIYTFGLEIHKVDAMNHELPLAGAEFILYRTISGKTTYAQAEKLEDGKYGIKAWVDEESDATKFVTSPVITGDDGKKTGGTVMISGVKAGGFYVKETKAPNGYNLLNEPLEVWIKIQDDKLNNESSADDVIASVGNAQVVANPSSGIVSATIENASGTVLPSTGGIGTTIFYALGGVLVVAALILLVTKRRMNTEE